MIAFANGFDITLLHTYLYGDDVSLARNIIYKGDYHNYLYGTLYFGVEKVRGVGEENGQTVADTK